MRVLIWSAPPWERTGYGVGARHLTQLLSGEHQVAVSPMTRVPLDLEVKGVDYAPIGAGYGLVVW